VQLNITATLGTLNVAAEVEGVKVKGDGEMHVTLSSSLLPSLNRQLQFVSYTNTLFHPSTADTREPAAVSFAGCFHIQCFFKRY
jgi:(N-acetylneuraminyl)-galactosylglucosylceramide N-acetylgalactosaminyltransferase